MVVDRKFKNCYWADKNCCKIETYDGFDNRHKNSMILYFNMFWLSCDNPYKAYSLITKSSCSQIL